MLICAILGVPGTFLSLVVEVCKSSLKAPTKVQWLGLTKRRVAVVLVATAFASCSGGLLLLLLELLLLLLLLFCGGWYLRWLLWWALRCPQQNRTSKTRCILGIIENYL